MAPSPFEQIPEPAPHRPDPFLVLGHVDQVVPFLRIAFEIVELLHVPDARIVDELVAIAAQGERRRRLRERVLPAVLVDHLAFPGDRLAAQRRQHGSAVHRLDRRRARPAPALSARCRCCARPASLSIRPGSNRAHTPPSARASTPRRRAACRSSRARRARTRYPTCRRPAWTRSSRTRRRSRARGRRCRRARAAFPRTRDRTHRTASRRDT